MKNIDFLPEKIKALRQRRKRLVRQVYLVALCAATLVGVGYVRSRRTAKAETQFFLISERSKNVQRQLAMLDDLHRQEADLLIKKKIDEQLGSRISALDVLVELGRVLPESVTVTSLNLKPAVQNISIRSAGQAGRRASGRAGSRSKVRSVNRVRLDLTGLAPANVVVAKFVAGLSTSPVFEDVQMGTTKGLVIDNHKAREFTVSCYVIR